MRYPRRKKQRLIVAVQGMMIRLAVFVEALGQLGRDAISIV
jgi:hypothetical protein